MISYLRQNSLKQLIRTPIRTILFFLLIMAVSLLMAVSSAMLAETSESIKAAESQFVTLAVVEQTEESRDTRPLWNTCLSYIEALDISSYEELLSPDVLDFEGADYVQRPETRPYYVAYLPDHTKSFRHLSGFVTIAEFTFIERQDETKQLVKLERILYKSGSGFLDTVALDEMISEGNEIQICTHNQPVQQDFVPGRRYIGTLGFDQYSEEGGWDAECLVLYAGPFTTQVDRDSHMAVDSGIVPSASNLYRKDDAWSYIQPSWTVTPKFSKLCYADQVTEDFYEEGGKGEVWLQWAEGMERIQKAEKDFLVIPTNSLDMLPSFHDKSAVLKQGRGITGEEFSSGAPVCLVSNAFLGRNLLKIGDKISLPLEYSMYGDIPESDSNSVFGGLYSPMNAEGRLYEPFWEAEYEIVGTFDMPFNEEFKYVINTGKDIQGDSFIIPAKSVKASDADNIAYYAPMNPKSTSFIIPNGSIEEFDKRLHEAVPEASKLVITYNDNGYTEVMDSLNSARLSGVMLFCVALFAALAIVVLLLYFFVVKERKRTAIERSLGMTKRQCRISLVSGIAAAALTASLLGSIGGAALMDVVDSSTLEQEKVDTEYSLEYSSWAQKQDQVDFGADTKVSWAVYASVPLLLTTTILILSVGMVNKNMRTEPIYLLSTKGE